MSTWQHFFCLLSWLLVLVFILPTKHAKRHELLWTRRKKVTPDFNPGVIKQGRWSKTVLTVSRLPIYIHNPKPVWLRENRLLHNKPISAMSVSEWLNWFWDSRSKPVWLRWKQVFPQQTNFRRERQRVAKLVLGFSTKTCLKTRKQVFLQQTNFRRERQRAAKLVSSSKAKACLKTRKQVLFAIYFLDY